MTDPARLRAWWAHRQGLDGTLAGAEPAAVLERSGWARSVGGANPYLTLFARAGTGRAAVDAAVAALAVHELPSARGCTYVVPAADFGLALQVGRGAALGEVATVAKLGVTRAEIDRLGELLLDALATRPLDPAELREALGGAVRSLGEEGRRKGVATTLPVALGLLQAEGEIRRVPVNGRLDQQRYAYARWTPPRSGLDDAAARRALAERYFRWAGPASVAHLRWFSGLGAADAKGTLADLELVDVGDGLLALPEDARAYADFGVPPQPRYALVSGIDALVLLRRDLRSLLDPADAERAVPGDPKQTPLGAVSDLPDHAIVDRGRVVGLWEYDPDSESIAWWAFGAAGTPAEAALRESVERCREFVRDQLGDARGFSLDSPKSRAPRLAALRATAAAVA
jgi:hypothetical protein